MSISEKRIALDGAHDSERAAERVLVDELPDGVLVMSAMGSVKSANRAFLEMVGRSEAEVVGCTIESIVAEEDMLHLVGVETMFREATRDASVLFTAADGSSRRLLICSAKSADLRSILVTTRAAGAVQEELASTTRWAASEQERAQELALARDALTANNLALRAAQEEAHAAYRTLQAEVAARERLEKELRLAQKLEGIGQLAAGVAHEINTPMQYIGDNIAFLGRAFASLSRHLGVAHQALTGETASSLEEAGALLCASNAELKLKFVLANVPKSLLDAKTGVEHVSSIVRAMKSFAHVDQDDKVASDINQAIMDTLTVAQSEYKSVATVEADLGQLPPVVCFLGRLNQVFLNLIVNAAHAIGEVRQAGEGKIRVVSRVAENVISIAISDNGSGIPEQIQDKIFDQFFTTKPVGKGSGQGLSLARSIVVDAHGGTLTFETRAGVGSTFLVRLPADGRARLTVSRS
ncbi:MAG TPA: ATP-binding protein [Polyangiaceae bacterium]|jgi:PAS domain S-box-containing protein